jgi:hypothetical protein
VRAKYSGCFDVIGMPLTSQSFYQSDIAALLDAELFYAPTVLWHNNQVNESDFKLSNTHPNFYQ